MVDLSGSQLPATNLKKLNLKNNPAINYHNPDCDLIKITGIIQKLTLVGSKPTRPQARAATPVQPCEIATIPIESGPGCIRSKESKMILLTKWYKSKQ